jgi:hypothetical protein
MHMKVAFGCLHGTDLLQFFDTPHQSTIDLSVFDWMLAYDGGVLKAHGKVCEKSSLGNTKSHGIDTDEVHGNVFQVNQKVLHGGMICIVCDVEGSTSKQTVKLHVAGAKIEDKWVSAEEVAMHVEHRGRSHRAEGIRYNGGGKTIFLESTASIWVRCMPSDLVLNLRRNCGEI